MADEEQSAREVVADSLGVRVPPVGEFLVRDGVVMPVSCSDWLDSDEDEDRYEIWVKRVDGE